jgi:acyl dehydratase
MPEFYEDVAIGDTLPEVVQKVTIPVMQRWVASSETLRRDHYDAKFAIEHDGLPNAVMSGSFSQAYIWQLLFNWAGLNGWVLKAAQKNARMVHPGTTITFFGTVTGKYEADGLGYVELEIGLRGDDGAVAVPGTATVVLPLRGGRQVPYPFTAGPQTVAAAPAPAGHGSDARGTR